MQPICKEIRGESGGWAHQKASPLSPAGTDAASTPTQITMAYSQKIIDTVMASPKTTGNQLGRWAIHLDFPVTKIAEALGVTRQTVYNWFEGKDVFVAYQHRVELLLKIMQSSRTADEAWRRICQEYNLEP